MDPRKSTSTLQKSTALPLDLAALVQSVFAEAYPERSADHEIVVDGRIFAEEIVLRVGFYPQGSIRPRNFEASIDYDLGKQNATDRVHLCVDALDAMVRQYFEADGDIALPAEWTQFNIDEAQPIYLKTSTFNAKLEAMAAALLAETGVSEDTEESELEAAMDSLFAKNPNETLKH